MYWSPKWVTILAWCLTGIAWASEGSKSNLTIYGFLLPTYTLSDAGVESFSQQNAGAYTAAGNPVQAGSPSQARSTFQVAQSRFGFLIEPEPSIKGRLEFDFIDFSKSSPTTAALPRLRRAVVDIIASDSLRFRFGQDWDLISPLGPHGFNLVGHYFQSGDIGFMRIQAQALLTAGNWEHAIALGLPGNNNSATDANLELTVLPTISFRETYRESKLAEWGFSGIAASLRSSLSTADRIFAGAVTLFGLWKPVEGLELRSEMYFGQNTSNLGALGLGFANHSAPAIQEVGAYVTGRYSLSTSLAVFTGAGGSWVLNPEDMLSSYTSTGSLSNTGPGLERNWTTRLGLEWAPFPSLVAFTELAGLFSRHHLLPRDQAEHTNDREAWIAQSGVMLSF